MAKKGIKETLLSTLVHGEEIISSIRVMRKNSNDKISTTSVTAASDRIHPKQLNLVLNEIIDTNENAKILRFISKDGMLPPFEGGQYITVTGEVGGSLTSRAYSLSSSPSQRGYYEITVETFPGGFFSKHMVEDLKIGDEVIAYGPNGTFTYNPVFHKKKSLFLAGGSSITPFLSQIRETLHKGLDRDIVLLYGSKDYSHCLYNKEFEEYAKKFPNFKYHLIISEKEDGYNGDVGFLDKEYIAKHCPDYLERTAYICGPNVMHYFVKQQLELLGLKRKDIRDEMFGAPMCLNEEPGYPKGITKDQIFNLTVGDKTIPARADESILVALERAKIRVNVCCRSGVCSLCRVKLIKGQVFVANGTLTRQADEKFNYIHSCKSYPISDLTIEL